MNKNLSSQNRFSNFLNQLRVGWFLAYRDIRGANKWTTALIICVMVLTFLNLVVVSGILVGLIEGSVDANKRYYGGDVIISPHPDKGYVLQSQEVLKIVKATPGFLEYTARYGTGGELVSNYRDTLALGQVYNKTGAFVVGINPEREDQITGISNRLIEGEYISRTDVDSIVIGSDLLFKYSPIETPSQQTLKNIGAGSRLLIKMGPNQKEFFVKGVVKTKVNDVDLRVFMNESAFRKLAGRDDLNVYEIVILLDNKISPEVFKKMLQDAGVESYARVRTREEAQPKFLKDISATFGMLGNIIGSIGLVVASITIFIVIFVNAVTRRRFIGILKGVGISSRSIEFSYILQALFYAVVGVAISFVIIFGMLKPYFDANPINFPFSDGILSVTLGGTFIRAGILFLATLVAGFAPARLIVRQNTLDAILGR